MNKNDINKINTPPKTKQQRLFLLQKLFPTINKAKQALVFLNQIKRPTGNVGIRFGDIHGVSLSEMYDIKERLNFVYSQDNVESVICFRHDGEDAVYNPSKKHFVLTTFRLVCEGGNWLLASTELQEILTILEKRKDKIFEPIIQGLDRQNFHWEKIKILFNGTQIKISQGDKDLGEYDLEVLKFPKETKRNGSNDNVSVRDMFGTLFLINNENRLHIAKNISNKNKNIHKQKERLKRILTEAFGTFDDPFQVKRPNKKTAGTYEPKFETGLYGDLEERSVTFFSGTSMHKQTEKEDWDEL